MANKILRIFKEWRVWLLLIFVVLALLSIPSFKQKGVEVSFVSEDSIFVKHVKEGDFINSLNGIKIETLEDYATAASRLNAGDPVSLVVNGQTFKNIVASSENNTTAGLGINVRKTSPIKIPLGLELQGGARVLLKPVPAAGTTLNESTIDLVKGVLTERLNIYGLKGMSIRKINDVEGNAYIEVEMAGEGSEKVVGVVKSVGRFELKIMNETIFTGDGIVPPIGEPRQDSQRSGGWEIPFTINKKAAEEMREGYVKFAPQNPQTCSSDNDCNSSFACSYSIASSGICLPRIEMFLDNKKGFSAPPSQSLHQTWLYGEETKDLVVQSGTYEDARKVEVVLKAGQLPNQIENIEVISEDYIDPKLGRDFLRGAAYAAVAALIAVGIIIFVRYRRLVIALPIMVTGISEVIIILGLAVLIKWSIDLPAIAGLIAAVGTGLEQQIIIADEILGGERKAWGLKGSIKKAYGIIVAAISTMIVTMLPLAYPGFTGLYALRGFAIVTIFGALIGLLISRPAFSKIVEILLEEAE